jgi:hypothetical protein
MGTILASSIISDMRDILHDTDSSNYRRTDATMLKHLNDAQRFIVQHVPKAWIVNTSFQLAAGVVQSLPTGGMELVSLDFNMGTDGSTMGAPIRLIEIDSMNILIPGWTTATAAAAVQMFMFNEKDPSHFYVYPPQPATGMGYVKGPYSTAPTDIATTGTAITLNDIFAGPMMKYGMFLELGLETDALAQQQSLSYYNLCVTEIGRKDLVMKSYSPNMKQQGV